MTSMKQSSRPTCPFCGVPWGDEMIEHYESMTSQNDCACCAGPQADRHSHSDRAPAIPVRDLCCTSCHRAIYLAPVAS